MSRTTEEYLNVNEISPSTGLYFTCNDYDFLKKFNLKTITINKDRINDLWKPREETLSKYAILNRIIQLTKMCIKTGKIDQRVIDNINKNILVPERLTPILPSQ